MPPRRAPVAARPPADPPVAESVLAIRKHGSGHQYQIKWAGLAETTWEAASRVRREVPQLVLAFEQGQPAAAAAEAAAVAAAAAAAAAALVAAAGADGAKDAAAAGAADRAAAAGSAQPAATKAADGSSMQQQLEAMAELVRAQNLQLAELRASPQQSPQSAARSLAAAAAASATAAEQPSRFARREPRAQDLREYDGAAAKLDDWLQELALATDLYELNPREALKFAASRLRAAALQWWLALSAPAKAAMTGADALGQALRARFQPVTSARVAREQLLALQQGSRHVNDYIADFQRLHTQLPGMAEDDALHLFERGLRRDLAEKLRVQGVRDLQEAVAMAARVGGLLQAPAAPHGRTAAINQMDIDDGAGASLDDRIQRAVLNAMSAHSSSGMGAKSQTQRGYAQERQQGGGAGNRGGRFAPRAPMVVPGVPEAVVRQRLDAKQCVRCGGDGHRSPACPNAITASGN